MINISKYTTDDEMETIQLIRETVRAINVNDYTEEQIKIWSNIDINVWKQSLMNKHAIVAKTPSGIIVGFADMSPTGYLDRLYIHKDFQRTGIAKKLVNTLENLNLSTKYYTYASKTAVPFFKAIGYNIVKENKVVLQGQSFINYKMEKDIIRMN